MSSNQVQLAIAATLRFRESKGRFPALLNEQDAVELAALAKALSEEQKSQEGACWLQKVEWGFPSGEPAEDMEAVEANLKRFSMLFDVELTGPVTSASNAYEEPMAAVIHDMVVNCDIQGLKATLKDMQKEGVVVQDEVTSHEFGRRGARTLCSIGFCRSTPDSYTALTAMTVRGRAEIMQLLLSTRADPNTSDDAGTTCFHFAADLGHARVAYHLLRAGADPSLRNGFGSRPTDKLVTNSWDPEDEVLEGKDQIRRLIAGERIPFEILRDEPDAPEKTVTMCAFLGGVVAQEVIKKTGKYTPIEQWVHHDDASLVQPGAALGEYAGTRYAHQAAVFGSKFMDDIRNQRVFLVGCGALGCEYLKGLALMGACSGPNGKLIVTDMDRIEVSNLSRQFLFRQPDVGNPKSTSAARVVKGWNPDLKIEALEKGVGDLCWNALDNVIARRYTDKCCLWYGLPLLESGTLGTKCNSDVFLPHLTKSYNDGIETDTNEAQIAMCTLRSFPFLPLHCIEFAKQAS
eukprot:g24960.t1